MTYNEQLKASFFTPISIVSCSGQVTLFKTMLQAKNHIDILHLFYAFVERIISFLIHIPRDAASK